MSSCSTKPKLNQWLNTLDARDAETKNRETPFTSAGTVLAWVAQIVRILKLPKESGRQEPAFAEETPRTTMTGGFSRCWDTLSRDIPVDLI